MSAFAFVVLGRGRNAYNEQSTGKRLVVESTATGKEVVLWVALLLRRNVLHHFLPRLYSFLWNCRGPA